MSSSEFKKGKKLIGKCIVHIGFLTALVDKHKNDNFIDMYELPSYIWQLDNHKNDKFFFYFNQDSIIEVKRKNFRIYSCEETVELHLKYPFYCKDEENSYIKNKFVDFEDQLIRYWILKPILILNFQSKVEAIAFIEILLGKSFDKMKRQKLFEKIISSQTIKNEHKIKYSLVRAYLKYLQERFLEALNYLPDNIQYVIFVLISSGILRLPIDVDYSFISFIFTESILKSHTHDNLYSGLVTLTEKSFIENWQILKLFKKYYTHRRRRYRHTQTYDYKVQVKKIYITPNLILFQNLNIEDTNRVLDLFERNYVNNFLRVSLTNDKFKKLFYCFSNKSLIDLHIKPILEKGIYIADRKYTFLGYSNSQLKSHSFWMLNETENLTYDKIFERFGEFKDKNVSKNAARKGLCFTNSKHFREITNIEIIDDDEVILKDENDYCSHALSGISVNKNYNFTDGIGMISLDLVREICRLYDVDYASAFQIRVGGSKGILLVNEKLKDDTIILRNSMVKFDSNMKDLYVIRPSSFSSGFLNKQIINLLSFWKIKDEIFIHFLEKNLKKLERLLDLNIAENELYIFKGGSFVKNLLCELIKSKNKVSLVKDPFVFGLTRVIYLSIIENIKNKAKIYVKKSGKFIGVIDEKNILKEGEVFIRVCKHHNHPNPFHEKINDSIVVKGPVIITKNPCMYPGDIQVCKAVDNPELYHLVNVVVFPKVGKRPIQQLISDGDLDGDIYFICWDEKLIPFGKNVIPSMNYYESMFNINCDKKPKEIDNVKQVNIINFMCDYLQNDILGTLCNKHLVLSDKENLLSKNCLKLSCYQSSAVNFGKYGETVSYEKINFKINKWPDFMEKDKSKSYRSEKILGQLYRKVTCIHEQFSSKLKNGHIEGNFSVKPFELSPGFEIFLHICNETFCYYYQKDLTFYLGKYDLKSEFEFLGGILIKFKNNIFGCDDFEIAKSIKEECSYLINYYLSLSKFIIYQLYHIFKYIYRFDPENWRLVVLKFNSKTILDITNLIDAKYSSEYEKFINDPYINDEISKIQNDKLYDLIKMGFMASIIYITYKKCFVNNSILLNVINKDIFISFVEQIVKKKTKKERKCYLKKENEQEYYENDRFINEFYSLPWIIDYSFIIRFLSV